MDRLFNTIGKHIYTNQNHKGFLVDWRVVAPLCKTWSRNREPDQERVAKMNAFHNDGGYIPRMIHLADVAGEGLVCYDGNHRREVFNAMADDTILCVVDVLFGASQSDVYAAFNNINKAVPLPAIFMGEHHEHHPDAAEVKVAILKLVKEYETKHRAYLSTSARCHAPHFNRDALVDNIHAIYTGFNGARTVDEIGALLEKLNAAYAAGDICRPHVMYKPGVIEKCQKGDLWLFLERHIPFEHVERVAHQDA